eukprot:5011252-Pleurochrysis_carterae.AAC.1
MKGTGTVYFTAGQDVVREATVDGATTTLVQLMEIAEDAIIQLPVQQLLMASDGVLQGVLSYDQRRGAAAPHMRLGSLPAALSPCRGKPLAQAVA